MPEPVVPPPEPAHEAGKPDLVKRSTIVVTTLAKVLGLAFGLVEIATHGQKRPLVLMFCGVAMLGADAVERIVLGIVDRILGKL